VRVILVSLVWLILSGAARAQPNLIVIMSDDQGTNAVSAYGPGIGGVVSTPNIDRIASEGVLFVNAFGVDQTCAPNRATLLTGKYGHRNGVMRNGDRLDAAQTTVADVLKAAGYRTVIIGKWHLVTAPRNLGFDDWSIFVEDNPPYANPRFDRYGELAAPAGYVTDLITAEATAWLDENRAEPGPFALFLMHKAPHSPFVPAARHESLYPDDLPRPETFDDRWLGRAPPAQLPSRRLVPDLMTIWLGEAFQSLGKALLPGGLSAEQEEDWIYQQQAKDYLRTLAALDESVGEVLAYLDAHHDERGLLASNTAVIYTSDNGNLVGEHFSWGKSRPYEEALRVPLLLRAPGVASGVVVSQTVLNTDTAPTLLDLAGVAIPGDMQGRSVLELLSGPPPPDWRTGFYFNHYEWGVGRVVPYFGIRTPRYKLIRHYGREWGGAPAWELIDLETDPGERTNVYDDPQYAGVAHALKWEVVMSQMSLDIRRAVVACPGDLNGDGFVGTSDLPLVQACRGSLAEGACEAADFDGDGIVTTRDWGLFGQTYGRSCNP
jgi:arylsulfatase A-like enzyme